MEATLYTYKQFKQAVNAYLIGKIGLSADDLADCQWRDLFEDTFEETGVLDIEALIDCVVEYNPEVEEFLRD
jgi:hypothetical protein